MAAPSLSKTGLLQTCALALVVGGVLPSLVFADVTIRLATKGQPHIEVDGIPADTLAALEGNSADHTSSQNVLSIFVVNADRRSTSPVLGEYSVEGGRLVFTPRFPLKPGLKYRAVFDPAGLPRARGQQLKQVEAIVSVPAPPLGKPTNVAAIYPSADVLPENQLKFYIHFSAPMSRGNSYRHIQLLDDKGSPVEAPYLELAEELWDESGKRLTLLLDPGRVKQDLKPHAEVGGVLVEGRAYTFHINNDWRDARGASLATEFRKSFRVTSPDVGQPAPERWKLTLPAAGTRDPLVVAFDEPLDHAMLQHAIRISDSNGQELQGRIAVEQCETRWTFHPAVAWRAGRHELLVDAALEDLAGNSIERPFEVVSPAARPAKSTRNTVAFTILAN